MKITVTTEIVVEVDPGDKDIDAVAMLVLELVGGLVLGDGEEPEEVRITNVVTE